MKRRARSSAACGTRSRRAPTSGSSACARASASRPVRRTRTTRRRCSASPTRCCTWRSGRAPGCDSSRSIRRVQKYVLSELDSGERVISEKVPSVRSVSIGFWIGAGSRDERDDRAGVSHFIEHLLFKGSRSYDAQQIAETFDAMGAELNAATSREHTVVYARVPDRHADEALEVMTDMVFAPAFAELDQEREVVLEEIAMYEDTPQELVHDLFSEAVFGSHALGRPVIGTADVISSVTRRSIAAYHRSMYTGGNIVVAAAGNIAHDRFVSLLERFERNSGAAGRSAPRVRRPLTQAPPPGLRFERKETEQYHLCLGAPGISR